VIFRTPAREIRLTGFQPADVGAGDVGGSTTTVGFSAAERAARFTKPAAIAHLQHHGADAPPQLASRVAGTPHLSLFSFADGQHRPSGSRRGRNSSRVVVLRPEPVTAKHGDRPTPPARGGQLLVGHQGCRQRPGPEFAGQLLELAPLPQGGLRPKPLRLDQEGVASKRSPPGDNSKWPTARLLAAVAVQTGPARLRGWAAPRRSEHPRRLFRAHLAAIALRSFSRCFEHDMPCPTSGVRPRLRPYAVPSQLS